MENDLKLDLENRYIIHGSVLTIRNAQMRAIEDAILVRWIRTSLERSHASSVRRALNDRGFNLESAVARARLLGLKFPEDILRFSRLTALLGSEFERDPEYNWTREYLEDWDPDVGERVARLEAEVLRGLGEDVA